LLIESTACTACLVCMDATPLVATIGRGRGTT